MSLISYNIALLNILSIFKYYRSLGRTAGLQYLKKEVHLKLKTQDRYHLQTEEIFVPTSFINIQTPTTIPTTELRLTKNVSCASKGLIFVVILLSFLNPYNTLQIPYYLYLKITGDFKLFRTRAYMLDLNAFWEDGLFIKDVFVVIILYSNL